MGDCDGRSGAARQAWGAGTFHGPAPRPGGPARTRLDTIGANPANLIVLGNRALGTDEGRPLGAVPGSAVRDVVGDVLERQRPLTDVTGADR
jgi:hypothetical protein